MMSLSDRRAHWGFHAAMAGIYLGVVGSELAGSYAFRDAILLFGIALCSSGLVSHWLCRIGDPVPARLTLSLTTRNDDAPSQPGTQLD